MVARAWRTIFVTASRSASESAVSSAAERCETLEEIASGSDGQRHAGGLQSAARGFHLGGKSARTVPDNRLAHFSKRRARDAFDVGNLGCGALAIARFITLDQPVGEFSLQHDHRKSVSQNVVQVARDAFALSNRGERDILFLRRAKLALGTPLLREKDVATADDGHQKNRDQRIRPTDVDKASLGLEDVAFAKNQQNFQRGKPPAPGGPRRC